MSDLSKNAVDAGPVPLNDEEQQDLKVFGVDAEVAVIEAETTQYSDEYMSKLRWKIDVWLLPLMWFCYGTQQTDKTSLATQAVFGIREDTGLVGEQYNWLTTIFYLTYLICEFPGNWLMQRLNMGKFLSVVMVLWGVIVLCVAFAKNFTHLMILRGIQGALECTISPTFVLLTGMWYTSQEHTLRSLIWGTATAGMNIITGLCMYAIGQHAERHVGSLAPWKGISFFLGGLTIVLGVIVWFVLGTPREVRWLSEEEKKAAIYRVMADKTGTDRQKRSGFNWKQAIDTFKDPQTYFFFFVVIINCLPNGANTTFSKLIWKSFGFTPLETLLKGATPYYCVSICWFVIVGVITYKKPGLRFFFTMLCLVPAFTGMLALSQLPTDSMKWTRWGMYIMQVFGNLSGIMIWTFIPSNVAGRTKKTVISTVTFVAYCVGNAIGAQMMVASDAPKYVRGITACAILYVVEFTLMGFWRFYYVWENRRRARIIEAEGLSAEERERRGRINAESDMTDRENIYFVYKY